MKNWVVCVACAMADFPGTRLADLLRALSKINFDNIRAFSIGGGSAWLPVLTATSGCGERRCCPQHLRGPRCSLDLPPPPPSWALCPLSDRQTCAAVWRTAQLKWRRSTATWVSSTSSCGRWTAASGGWRGQHKGHALQQGMNACRCLLATGGWPASTRAWCPVSRDKGG